MKENDRITLVIADDHPIVLKGLREEIESDTELKILGEAMDGEMALALIRQHQPQVSILDVGMPRMSGLDVARHLQEDALPTAVIILTVFDDDGIFSKAIDLGVMGYILKDSTALDIIRGIKRVARGDHFISPALTNKLVHPAPAPDSLEEQRLGLHLLTGSERRILRLIAADKSTKEIAEELFISPKTVNSHRTNISSKLHLSGSFSLLRFAMENKTSI
ncbi:MAG: response regulator transcription factor [Bacteroidota bacterium]|jgi:DNA-binding NarL/FixJ family response regulator